LNAGLATFQNISRSLKEQVAALQFKIAGYSDTT